MRAWQGFETFAGRCGLAPAVRIPPEVHKRPVQGRVAAVETARVGGMVGNHGLPMIGTAGWSIPAAAFPREGSHLVRYAARFPAIEINSSFAGFAITDALKLLAACGDGQPVGAAAT